MALFRVPSCHLLPAACLLALASPAAAQDLLVKAGRLIVAPDTELTDSALLVRGGKVAYVGAEIPAEARAAARVLDLGKATVAPGFVDAHAWLGQEGDLTEVSAAITPSLRTADAFDPFQDELAAHATAGITSAAFAPSSRNVFGGIAALVKPGRDSGALIEADLYLKAAVVPPARDQERPPTSLMGVADLMRTTFAAAGAAVPPADLLPVRECLQGGRRLFVHASSHAELTTALAVCRDAGIEPVLLGAAEVDRCLAELKAAGARVVLGPLTLDSRPAQLALPALLEKNGVRFAFGGGAPAQLRLTAALAIRSGLSRRAALDALTRAPAELLQQQARIGALRAGCDADFTAWSGDPLDLGARLLSVHVQGVLVATPTDATSPSTPAGQPAR